MQGDYPGNRGVRPLGVCGSQDDDAAPARLFVCAGCRAQAVICSCCDNGQIYCAGDCARHARRHAQGAAGRRYQSSRRGRLAHAARARRYRARCKKVTHQGSPEPAADGLLSTGPPAMASDAASLDEQPQQVARRSSRRGGPARLSRNTQPAAWRCHWCGRPCPDVVRQGFLRRRLRRRGLPRPDRIGRRHGDAP
jgi:hypothetical protein